MDGIGSTVHTSRVNETTGRAGSRRTVCCHCEARCGVVVEVDDEGLPISISGDRDHPISQGFLCVRGRAAIEYFADPRRLRAPAKRVGRRGSGSFVEISWEQAYDEISEQLLRIAEESGPEAVAYLNGTQFGADGWFGYRLMHLFGSPNSGGTGLMCGGPQFAAGALTHGFSAAFPDVTPGVTNLVVLWGQQPSASSPMYWSRIRQTTEAGAELMVVDPRPTREARAASLWLQPRPASDAALALSVLNVIIEEGLWDEAFVSQWTYGFPELRDRVAAFPPEVTEPATGVPATHVRRFARLYAGTPNAALSIGTPNGHGRNALNLERSLAIMIALTGKLDREGCNVLLGPTPDIGSEVTYDAYAELPPEQRKKRLGADRFRLHGEGVEILAEAASRAWYRTPYPITRRSLGLAHPLAIMGAIETGEPYQVRGLLIQHHNAVGAYPDSARVLHALGSSRLELLVVHDLQLTPTATLADYVLPAASWMEKPFLLSQGWGTPIVAGERVVEPQYSRASDYDFCRDLGRRLGQTWPDTVEEVYDEWLAGAGHTFESLLEGERLLAGSTARRRFATIDPETGHPFGFGTPTGRVELVSTVLERLGYDGLPDSADTSTPTENDHFPLRLMTGATRITATHQDHRHLTALRSLHPDPIVEIDPRLATQLALEDGDWARIITPAGEIRQRVSLVPNLGIDRVNAERWWYPERDGAAPNHFGVLESNVNSYTQAPLDQCDPAYGALPYRDARCRLEPCKG